MLETMIKCSAAEIANFYGNKDKLLFSTTELNHNFRERRMIEIYGKNNTGI